MNKTLLHYFRVFLASILAVSFVLLLNNHAMAAGKDTISQPQFTYSSNEAKPVIEFTQIHHMLAEQDPVPLLRVYGNGRVHVHFPVYMKKAGDYELYLSEAEVNNLLKSLSKDGIIDFDHQQAMQQRRLLEIEQFKNDKVLFHVSDVTETVIKINLNEYRRGPKDKLIVNMKKVFLWKNLEHDSRRFPQLNVIQSAARGQRNLYAFLNHPNLKKIK